MQRLTEESRLDGATQQRIISLAAELQRLEEEGATLHDLEARAREVGIDPKYVRIAMGQVAVQPQPVQTVPAPTSPQPWYRGNELALFSLAVFAAAQIYNLSYFIRSGYVRFPMWLGLAAVLLGMAFSRNRSHRIAGVGAFLAVSLGSVVVMSLITGLGSYGVFTYRWRSLVASLVMTEFALLCVGILAGTCWQWLQKLMKRPA
jgi:hypothetical protein